jgi:hypothetical protein
LLATAGLLLTAPCADAAVVQLRSLEALGNDAPAVQLQVTALPGETYALTMGQPGDGSIVLGSAGAPLAPGRGCTRSGSELRCTPPPGALLIILVSGGAGAGSVSLAQMRAYERSALWGGDGADTLTGGPGTDDLFGGAGDDVLAADAGDDRLDPGPGADVLRGGPGVDLAWYAGREPQAIALGGAALASGDDVGVDVENVHLGDGADRVVGSDVANELSGGRGSDEIDGRGGNDRISSHGFGARLVGGAGRDFIAADRRRVSVDARDGERDRVRCPAGMAAAPLADAIDRLDGCVPPATVMTRRARVAADGSFPVTLRCRAIDQRCQVRLAARYVDTDLATRTVSAPAGVAAVVLRLGASGRRLLARLGKLAPCVAALSYRTVPAPSERGAGCRLVELVPAP